MATEHKNSTVLLDSKDVPLSDSDIEHTPNSDASDEVGESEIYIDPKKEAKVLRKCDLYLMPLLTLCFLSAYLDRNNLGNAATAGLTTDLHMSTQQLASKSKSCARQPTTDMSQRCRLIFLRYM